MNENFWDFSELDPHWIKKHHVANQLISLMVENEVSREQLARRLKVNEKKVDRMLSGELNLKITDIINITLAMGYDFTLSFNK